MMELIESYRSGYCPKCGRDITEWGDCELDGEVIYFYFDCPHCGIRGEEVYSVEYHHTNGWEDKEV